MKFFFGFAAFLSASLICATASAAGLMISWTNVEHYERPTFRFSGLAKLSG